MNTKKYRVITTLGCVVILMSCLCVLYLHVAPADLMTIKNIRELRALISSRQAIELHQVQRSGKKYFVYVGKVSGFSVKSGPSVVVFDRIGNVVTKCQETGEGNKNCDRWLSATQNNSPTVSLEEILSDFPK